MDPASRGTAAPGRDRPRSASGPRSRPNLSPDPQNEYFSDSLTEAGLAGEAALRPLELDDEPAPAQPGCRRISAGCDSTASRRGEEALGAEVR